MSVGADIHFDAPAPLLPGIIALHARWRGSRPALIMHGSSGRHEVTWRALNARANRVARALERDDISRGDAVAIAMGNAIDTVAIMLGVIKAGAVATPLNLTISDQALAAMIADARPRILLAGVGQVTRFEGATPGAVGVSVGGEAPGWVSFEDWLADVPDTDPDVAIDDDDPINVIYSSGTTGRPKGIVHTHRRRLWWARDVGLALRYHAGAQTLCTLPLYSNISWVMLLCTLVPGGTLHLTERFDAGDFLALVHREAITHTALVPIQLQRIVDHADFASLTVRSLEGLMSCGSPLHPDLKQRIFDTFPHGVIELYGLTEGVITTLDPEDAAGRVESVGKPLPGTDLAIVGDDGREVPPGAAGEIASRGRILMTGYLNRPDASEEATWRDGSGRAWLRTGDLGRIDDEGYLYIVGRKKDMILSGGQNIYPADIESVLVGHPDVADVAVIGVPDVRWGETPLAVVELSPGRQADADALCRWVNERVGKFQRVSHVEVTDELPRNPNGKVLKATLRDRYQSS